MYLLSMTILTHLPASDRCVLLGAVSRGIHLINMKRPCLHEEERLGGHQHERGDYSYSTAKVLPYNQGTIKVQSRGSRYTSGPVPVSWL